LKQSYRSLQYGVTNLGTRFLSTCYANFWWIPSKASVQLFLFFILFYRGMGGGFYSRGGAYWPLGGALFRKGSTFEGRR